MKKGNKLIFSTHDGRRFETLFVNVVKLVEELCSVWIESSDRCKSFVTLPELHDSYQLPRVGSRFHSSAPNYFLCDCEISWLEACSWPLFSQQTNLSCVISSNIRWLFWFCFDSSFNSSYFSFAIDLKPSWNDVVMKNSFSINVNEFNSQWDSSNLPSPVAEHSEDSKLEPWDKKAPMLRLQSTLSEISSSDAFRN